MKIAFITNLPSHFHTRLFELLGQQYSTDFYFFSDGSEQWIEKKNALTVGNYHAEYLKGLALGSSFRLNFRLLGKLLSSHYDIIIHSIGGRFELITSFLYAKLSNTPFILWTNLWFHPRTLFHTITFPITKLIYRHSDALVVYGSHVSNFLETLGVPQSKIFYSWNITDNSKYNKQISQEELALLRASLGLERRAVILFVGRLSEEKGVRYLLDAFASLPRALNTSLIIIGRGQEKDKLIEQVRSQNIHNVQFLDYIANEKILNYYALADIFVLPSITTPTLKEVWGIVLNEAMNQGCPVIATNAVGAAVGGLVQEGKNGYIVPERNAQALTEAIVQLLSDQKKLQEMKEFTRKEIQSWDEYKSFAGFQQAIEHCLLQHKQ